MKHKQSTVIAEWLKDTEQVIEQLIDGEFCRCSIEVLIDTHNQDEQFRIKPREFNEGEWYQCVDDEGDPMVIQFTSGKFTVDGCGRYKDKHFLWIGKSLGKLKFGGDDD